MRDRIRDHMAKTSLKIAACAFPIIGAVEVAFGITELANLWAIRAFFIPLSAIFFAIGRVAGLYRCQMMSGR
ncbi:hypothetical protein RCH23_003288 [Cryobacterium sp. CAN_C3]|uniref:hypothetical protein n=1 Tax=unclassified Cryobacterium TaxID=2649013 RepID=UPI0018C97D71|nr:hypothetical protein [Cryobacterium sp. CAN_C3]MEC5155887.1 hypothetical protein [Cryobacterium sp. CAN_C3]